MTVCDALHSGHPKAGSYVRYLNTSELVSASSDSTSGLWDTKACTAGRVLSAANIEEDFVSLSVHGEVAARRTANEVGGRTYLHACTMIPEMHSPLASNCAGLCSDTLSKARMAFLDIPFGYSPVNLCTRISYSHV